MKEFLSNSIKRIFEENILGLPMKRMVINRSKKLIYELIVNQYE